MFVYTDLDHNGSNQCTLITCSTAGKLGKNFKLLGLWSPQQPRIGNIQIDTSVFI